MMNIHPYAQLFPAIDGDNFQQLVEDIRENGLYEPITLLDGAILDGRNRYRACEAAGVTPRFETFQGDSTAALNYVLSKNIHRRHLTSSQRAVLALEIEPLFAEAAKERQRLSAAYTNARLNRSYDETIIQRIGKSSDTIPAAKQAAEFAGSNHNYVVVAKQIARQQPELLDRVRAGEMTIPEAKRAMDGVDNSQKIRAIGSSESNEWYTPAHYIEAARQVMGGIDTDPASNIMANKWVNASTFYTQEDNGLLFDWYGRVWLNPPYGGGQAAFVAKLLEEANIGHVTEAVVLVNAHSTETNWFAPLWDHLLCFTDHRINFVSPSGAPQNGSNHGSVFIYIGANRQKFVETFGKFGPVVSRYTGE